MPFIVQSSTAILILLAMAVFAAHGPIRAGAVGWIVLGAACAGILTRFVPLAEAAVIGSFIIALVSVQLWTRFAAFAASFGLGLLAMAWAQLLTMHGVAHPLAGLIAFATLVAIVWVGQQRIRPADAALHIEALLIVLAAAVFVAAAPAVISGWRSAVALNAFEQPSAAGEMPGGGFALILICVAPLLLGALYSLWRRRRQC